MASVSPPPPPPPPPRGNQPGSVSRPPRPEHAAIPFVKTPVPDTNPPPEAGPGAEAAPAPPEVPVQNGPQFPPSDEENLSDSEAEQTKQTKPVPETNPGDEAAG